MGFESYPMSPEAMGSSSFFDCMRNAKISFTYSKPLNIQ